MDIRMRRERAINGDLPRLSESKLLFLGGLMGLTPSLKGGNGQPLAESAEVLRDQPGFEADAEFIERELFVTDDTTQN